MWTMDMHIDEPQLNTNTSRQHSAAWFLQHASERAIFISHAHIVGIVLYIRRYILVSSASAMRFDDTLMKAYPTKTPLPQPIGTASHTPSHMVHIRRARRLAESLSYACTKRQKTKTPTTLPSYPEKALS